MMSTQHGPKIVCGATVLVLLISVGYFFHSEWNFRRSLEKLTTESVSDVHPEFVSPREITTKRFVEEVEPERLEGQRIESEVAEIEMDNPKLTEFDPARDTIEFDEQSVEGGFPGYDMTEPIDISDGDKNKPSRKAAVADYNAYLGTDSEYAYERLADVFRADVGDCPEVYILVESIRKANNGPLTIDEAIAMKEAILSAYGYEEATADRLDVLRELKKLEAESGKPGQIIYKKITIE